MSGQPRLQDERTLTLEEFLCLPGIEEAPAAEFIDGRVVRKAMPSTRHSVLQSKIARWLDDFAEPPAHGTAFIELRCTFAGRSIVPDVAFLLPEHIEFEDDGSYVDGYFQPPDIHIEVRSPDQSIPETHEKLLYSTAHGCPLGWFIDPYSRTIDDFSTGETPERLPEDGALLGDPFLPGSRLPVAEVFGWLAPGPRRPPR